MQYSQMKQEAEITQTTPSDTSSEREWDAPGSPSFQDFGIHPLLSIYGSEVLSNPANFVQESCVDVLTVSGTDTVACLKEDQNDDQIRRAIEALDPDPAQPTLMLLCITLNANDSATFEQTASISLPLTTHIFQRFGLHGGFLPDLIGRPNYWAAVSQTRVDPVRQLDIFDLHCQHPRWHQKGRYDKQRKGATQGNKAPCSLYMTHSVATNTTLYLVVAPDDGIWFSFLERIRVGEHANDESLVPASDLAASPYLVHAMIAGIAFEQATIYSAELRNRLMTQLKQVNDYADSTLGLSTESLSRSPLQRITAQLHNVSQMINTGLGGASASTMLSNKLCLAHQEFCARRNRGEPGSPDQRTRTAFEYVRDAFEYQASWLEQYKTRKETAMSFVFNMVTQLDSSTNLETSKRMAQDSSSMHTITIVTMVFLPGTFTATLFSSVAFSATDTGKMQITDWLWPFLGVTLFLTVGVVTVWYFRARVARWRHALERSVQRRQAIQGEMTEVKMA